MIIRVKPKIDSKLKKLFDKLLATTDKTLPLHLRFLKNMTPDIRDQFMNYFSYKTKYDLKEYELIKRRYKNNEKLLIDKILEIVIDYKDSAIWKTDHLKMVRGIQLGQMYQIQYKAYKHDPYPLAIFLNTYDEIHQNFNAVNLHYFVPQFREYFVKQIIKFNSPRIKSDKDPILTMPMVEKIIPNLGIAYRNYKAEKIKVIEKISHHRWLTYLEIDKRNIRIKK